MKKSILTLLVLLPIVCQAQYGNVWAFGFHYGLDFNSTPPVFFDTLSISTAKGSASVCDSSGQLLFYTDGGRVWNKLNQLMPNGDSMAYAPLVFVDPVSFDSSYYSAYQAAVIIPIENTTKYYIFTTDFYAANNQLKYHIVDMAASGGLGDVILKNQILQTDISERLTTTRHCNGIDWWVISRKRSSDEYLSILVKPDSVVNNAVISHTGVNHISNDCCGFTKISPNGKWLATTYELEGVELASFNNQTGEVEILMQDFIYGWETGFSCSFSADSKYLYASIQFADSTVIDSSFNYIYEYFIESYFIDSGDSLQILQSKTILQQQDSIAFWTALQLAPDGNVYARGHIQDTTVSPQHLRDQIFYIKPGIDSTFATPFIFQDLPTGSSFGLPSFPDAIFTNHHKASLRIPTCIAGVFDSIPFFDSLLTTTRDYMWDFGDPASGINNTYNGQYPIHQFSSPGTYTVTLSLPSDCNPLAVTQQVTAVSTTAIVPIITLNNSYLESTPATQYQWYFNNNIIPSATAQSYLPITNGNYTVTITDSSGCSQTSQVYNLTTIGIKNTPNKNQFTVYPNPATETLHLINTAKKQATVALYDITGRPILQTTIYNYNETIDISHITNGVYFIKIENSFFKKLVISK